MDTNSESFSNQLVNILNQVDVAEEQQAAFQQLANFRNENLKQFIESLWYILTDESKSDRVRNLCGRLIHQESNKMVKSIRAWSGVLNLDTTSQILKNNLKSDDLEIRETSVRIFNNMLSISGSEKPKWLALMSSIISNTVKSDQTVETKISNLKMIGDAVELCFTDMLGSDTQVVEILTTICRGFDDIDDGVKLASADMLHSILLKIDKDVNCKARVESALERLPVTDAILRTLSLPNLAASPSLAAAKVLVLKCFSVIIASYYKHNEAFCQSIEDYIRKLPMIVVRKQGYFDVAIEAVGVVSLICKSREIVARLDNYSIILNKGETLRLILSVIVEGDDEGVEMFNDLKSACGNCISDILKLRRPKAANIADSPREILIDFIVEKTKAYIVDDSGSWPTPWQSREAGAYVSFLIKFPTSLKWVHFLVKQLLLNDHWAYDLNNVFLKSTLTMISAILEVFHHPGDGETPVDSSNANCIVNVLLENTTADGDNNTLFACIRSIYVFLYRYTPLNKLLPCISLQSLENLRKNLGSVIEKFDITDQDTDAIKAFNCCDFFIGVLKSG